MRARNTEVLTLPLTSFDDVVDAGGLVVEEVRDPPLLRDRRQRDGQSIDVPLEEMGDPHAILDHLDQALNLLASKDVAKE